MPSPLLQLRIPQDLADWLEAKHPSRGEVAEYVRQLLTAEQMKEAVAPLVPEMGTNPILSIRECAEATQAEPKPKARRKKGAGVDLAFEAMGAIVATAQTPARCNRGACTGTIKPSSGRCLRCNQIPLKESK